jgi:hypothetical protein
MDPTLPRACSVAALEAGEPPTGWAIVGRRFLLVEVPLPWPHAIDEAAGLPAGLGDLLRSLPDDHDPYFEAVVPDADYSSPGCTRVIGFDPEPGRPTRLRRTEVLIPTSEVTDLVRAWLAGEPGIPTVPADGKRDLVVCTHGAHDTCCGRFGAPLYRYLRDELSSSSIRVWRGSHTGGHRFAPTLVDLPDGRSWGRLDAAAAEAIVRREGKPADIRHRYRGWGLLPSFYERLVEAELMCTEGWAWLDRTVSGEVVAGHPFTYPEDPDELDDRAVVRLTEEDADGRPVRRWEGVVERTGDLVTRGECGDEPWTSPIYRVASVELVQ